MGTHCKGARKLGLELMGAIIESLGLGPNHFERQTRRWNASHGLELLSTVPNLALGLPPHSDYSCLIIVLQSSLGLQVFDPEAAAAGVKSWRLVPELRGALQVHVGDHFEVLSNGAYKSLVHRATLSREWTRILVASLHSLEMEEKMAPAEKLVGDDQERPKKYKESSFMDFLNFLATNDIA